MFERIFGKRKSLQRNLVIDLICLALIFSIYRRKDINMMTNK